MRLLVERANSLEGPEGMNRTFASRSGSYSLLQGRSGIRHLIVDDQALRGEFPELVATVERLNDFGRFRRGERLNRAFRTILPDDAVDAAMDLVAQVILRHVSTALSRGGFHAG